MSTTTTPTDPALSLMVAAFAETATIVESLSATDLDASTPCPGWDVAHVVEHIVGALEMFAGAVGVEPPTSAPTDPTQRVRPLTEAVAAGWDAPGRLDRTVELPFGTFPAPLAMRINLLETFVHGLDIACAVGREGLVDPALCDEVRETAQAAGFDSFRQPGMFGPAVRPSDGSPLAALMAFVGRDL